MATNKITNLRNPTVNGDAATKSYVDTQDSLKLPLTGGTLTGNLDIRFGTEMSRVIGVSDIAADKTMTLRLGNDSNKITYLPRISAGNSITVESTDGVSLNKDLR